MFKLRWSREARATYDALRTAARQQCTGRKAGLFKQVHKCLTFLAQDPRHPSLGTHKYSSIIDPSGQKRDLFEAYAQNDTPGAYRVFWCYGPGQGEITIVAITPHP